MTIDVNCLWAPMPDAGDWASQNAMDFSLDQTYRFLVGTTVQSEIITPKYLIIDNTINGFYLTLNMGGLDFTIPAATRTTVSIPAGMSRFQIMSAGAVGTATVIISEKKYVDDVTNQTAVVVPPSGGGGMNINLVLMTASGNYVVPANCTKIEVSAQGPGGAGHRGQVNIVTGGSGGGGGCAIKKYTVVAAQVCTVVIGNVATPGVAGTDTTFTDGVNLITGSVGGNATVTSGVGGLGGAATGGDINIEGGDGSNGVNVSAPGESGQNGADSFLGKGGQGSLLNTSTAALKGHDYGGGGGGGGARTAGAGSVGSGGNGGAGCVLIREYLS